MTIARKEIINHGEIGVYHCISRCVRRAWLCGKDVYTGKDYSHRKGWIEKRLEHLSNNFTIGVCGYAIMTNHIHLILQNRPDLAADLSDREIAVRWLSIYSGRYVEKGNPRTLDDGKVDALVADKGRIARLRKRICSISWFMKTLNENIARMANQEDDCKGKFWEGRFKCTRLLDASAVLACMAYVDLNPIRAGIANTPETSDYTSVKLRCRSRNAKRIGQEKTTSSDQYQQRATATKIPCDYWLAPVFRDNDTTPGSELISASLDQYIELLDWTGRQLQADKPGTVPAHLQPVIQRLEIDAENWLETTSCFGKRFYRIAGVADKIQEAAAKAGKRFFKGLQAARVIFCKPALST